MASKILKGILGQSQQQRMVNEKRTLLHFLAKMGGQLFGPIPKGVRREFFCLDEHTWVWHEEWSDQAGHHAITTRYDVRPTGILKSQGAHAYQHLTPQEEQHFRQAVQLYCNQANALLQPYLPTTA